MRRLFVFLSLASLLLSAACSVIAPPTSPLPASTPLPATAVPATAVPATDGPQLTPPSPTSAPTQAGLSELNEFSTTLIQAIEAHDFAAMRALMHPRFSIATFNTSLLEFPSDEAMQKLRESVFAPGAQPAARPGTDVVALLSGADPLGQWGPVANPVRALHVMGLGERADSEAVLVIARDTQTDRLYWLGILLPENGRYFTTP